MRACGFTGFPSCWHADLPAYGPAVLSINKSVSSCCSKRLILFACMHAGLLVNRHASMQVCCLTCLWIKCFPFMLACWHAGMLGCTLAGILAFLFGSFSTFKCDRFLWRHYSRFCGGAFYLCRRFIVCFIFQRIRDDTFHSISSCCSVLRIRDQPRNRTSGFRYRASSLRF